ncbi:pilus assembly protein PilP [Pasteurella canis]|uniref:pilus assembly protein PilP n=1 Tax=Pasteurella canis TaxID=753 RepID=UPI0022391A9C|nr:pilus assembly protein PilP [Pasteurella canis]UDW83738.1 pilus assembly protein PilP [Pasteurella canis]
MQKLTALILFSLTLSVQADPFDRTQRQTQSNALMKNEKIMSLTSCHALEPALFLMNDLNELKLIGVLQQQSEWLAFFMNEEKQIQSASLNQLLTAEGFRIQQISRQGITLAYWKNKQNCTENSTLFIKL